MVCAGHRTNVGLTGLKSRCWQGCDASRRLWRKIPFKSMQLSNSVPGCNRLEALFLTGCRQGVAGIPWLMAPFLLQSQQQQSQSKCKFWPPRWPPSLCSLLLHLLCFPALPPYSVKGSWDHIVPTWVTQAIPSTFRSVA